jgi:hypothetical protein
MFYKDRIQPHVEARLSKDSQKGKITVIQKVMKERWNDEDEETKLTVRTKLAEVAALKKQSASRSPEQYHVCI